MDLYLLKSKLKERNITQADVAVLLGCSQGKVSKIFRGDQIMKAEEADTIRRHLGYKLPEDLTVGTPERTVIDGLSELDEHGKEALASFLDALVRQPSRN